MDLVQRTLQPVMLSLPLPIHHAASSLLGPECHQKLLLDLDPTATGCLKLGISKALGLAIVAASSVVKVPQIVALIRSRSAAGVSFLTYLLETASFLISLGYSARQRLPFTTYGETALIAAQDVVVAVLVLRLTGRDAAAVTFVAGVGAALYALLFTGDRVFDARAWRGLQAAAGALAVVSKLPQIWTLWRAGHPGQLSAVAVFSYLLGSVTRIYTTVQEVDDRLILYGFVAGFVLNLVLAAQLLYYWAVKPDGRRSVKRDAKKKRGGLGLGGGKEPPTDPFSSSSSSSFSVPRAKEASTRRRP
ncbi:MAG: hypothetical protein M1826_000047 [Phylliscum demangeonii]|nr:MAG: hypothetical protein M1826_000047 [Phylliscum demangeonii]